AESGEIIRSIEAPGTLADFMAANLPLGFVHKQELLETFDVLERLRKVNAALVGQLDLLELSKKLEEEVRDKIDTTQRQYFLREQMKVIQQELGQKSAPSQTIERLRQKLAQAKPPEEVLAEAERELDRMSSAAQSSPEYNVALDYVQWIASLPWTVTTDDNNDINLAERILNEDHYGLDKVKRRVLEFLAVRTLRKDSPGPILCLAGPPGVGKTSLGRSIARATGRKFVRFSLGGVRDEAEIRGHRRTYIGSMPGKIVQGMKKAKASNPLFLLDEVDKMGHDWRGDPASALLEVLDPEQNHAFNDHYLEVDYDLSDVFFVTTANTLNMPPALLDRMEIIRLSGYTEDEKIEIAIQHLIPKQIKKHGLKEKEWSINDSALRDLIRLYTREAGVRNLEREIANLARKAITEILMGKHKTVAVTKRNLGKWAGIMKFRFGEIEAHDMIGVTTGLAWTEVGGELLSIESVIVPGKGKMTYTGKLGEVMAESIQAAKFFVQSRARQFGIHPTLFTKKDIHVHVPEGATPKDGPSAGVAMVTSIVSVLTGIKVKRDVAMTGEVTLRGRVLPIGGLKEKLLAALRGGITTVLIPQENEKDLAEIPDNVKRALKIIPVDLVDEVLVHALVSSLTPADWDEEAELEASALAAKAGDDDGTGVVTH
ncbi:MAG: endopeptidase La, partial [Proteobacteria bacterium]|nr:endopeptidase La [Pseudomonadota bacterium]